MKKITVITGHYGSGKTNISVNLALELAKTKTKVTVVDLDIVNPYFRTADFSELFAEHDVELVAPMYANSNLDIPAISFDLERIAKDDGYLIIDVGGDDDGAIALGRYTEALSTYQDNLDMLYVINCYRYFTQYADEALELMHDIENASRMKHTKIINNSNLGFETSEQTILDSMPFANEISQKANLPILFTAYKSDLNFNNKVGFKPVEIYVKPIWDK